MASINNFRARWRPDPKPPKRHKATPEEWRELARTVYDECGWRCVACGEQYEGALGLHHVVPKDRSGGDVVENLVVLCGYKPVKPTGCHKRLQEHLEGWQHVAGHVRMHVLKLTSRVAYVYGLLGLEGFDHEYPPPPHYRIGDLEAYTRPDSRLLELDAREVEE